MRRLLPCTIVPLIAALGGCGGDSSPPGSSPPPSSGSGETINGRERVGWSQPVSTRSDLAYFRYALYVDGTRRVLEGETCTETAAANLFDCSAPLPTLTAGAHTLELAVFVEAGDSIVESTRSSALRVTVAGVVASATLAAPSLQTGPFVSSDGVRLRADVIAGGLTDPIDLAAADDGRVVLADGANRIWFLTPGASTVDLVEPVRLPSAIADGRVASIALAPDFARSGIIFVAATADIKPRPRLDIIRYRAVGTSLGEAATIASMPTPRDAAVVMRIGPDHLLYVAVGSGDAGSSAADPASTAGKLMRLRLDGTTPDDNPRRSPVFTSGHVAPAGLAWRREGASMWEVERDSAGDEINPIVGDGDYAARAGRSRTRSIPAAVTLPADVELSGAAFVDAAHPLGGDLIVSARGAEDLLRVRTTADGRARVLSRLLQKRFGRIGGIAASASGDLFIFTSNTATWGGSQDVLLRITPDR